jgi:hypothetical protein
MARYTRAEILANAYAELDKARNALSEARDWVAAADPSDGAFTAKQRGQVEAIFDAVSEGKDAIDHAKGVRSPW